MSAIPQAHIEWSGEDEELYHDCESTKVRLQVLRDRP
jgi:hypothetical protein